MENIWAKHRKINRRRETMIYIIWSLVFCTFHRIILKGGGANKRPRLAEDLVSMREMRHECKILVGKPGGKISLGNIIL
jgi:hypothetical protein